MWPCYFMRCNFCRHTAINAQTPINYANKHIFWINNSWRLSASHFVVMNILCGRFFFSTRVLYTLRMITCSFQCPFQYSRLSIYTLAVCNVKCFTQIKISNLLIKKNGKQLKWIHTKEVHAILNKFRIYFFTVRNMIGRHTRFVHNHRHRHQLHRKKNVPLAFPWIEERMCGKLIIITCLIVVVHRLTSKQPIYYCFQRSSIFVAILTRLS